MCLESKGSKVFEGEICDLVAWLNENKGEKERNEPLFGEGLMGAVKECFIESKRRKTEKKYEMKD